MRIFQTLLPVAALSPLALTQSQTSAAPPLVTLDVIETRTTTFTGADASLGAVTLYEPISTVVFANATSGFLPFRNISQTTTTPRPKPSSAAVPAGDTTEYIAISSATSAATTSSYTGAAKPHATEAWFGLGAALGVAALLG